MKISQYHFNSGDLEIPPGRVGAMMGFENEPAPDPFPGLIEAELGTIAGHCDITGGYVILDASFNDKGTISVGGVPFQVGRMVGKFLAESGQVAIFVCTAGQKMSDRITDLANRGMISESYIADVIGSMIVEEAMDRIRDILKEEMGKAGLKITNRYSPGYCDWDIAEQKKLFSLLPEGFCRVKLTESSLMLPLKSVSGFIGIGRNVRYSEYVCELCNMRHCLYRRKA